MKRKTVLILASGVLLSMLHAVVEAQPQCSGQPVKLHLATNELKVTPPEPKCVTAPGDFTIEILPSSTIDPGIGEVVVHQKPTSSLDISGENDPDPDLLVVTVDGTGDSGAYLIEIAGHGKLDPEVRIVTRLSLFQAAIVLLEEELDLSLEEFEGLLREFRDQQTE